MVFVTGATGLIGSYLLVELTKRGKKIRAMKRSGSSLAPVQKLFDDFSILDQFDAIEWVETDLLDIPSLSDSLHGIRTIYHTAGRIGFDDRQRQIIHEVNVQGTENLVNLAIAQNIPEFIYISSISVLDPSPNQKEIDENAKWDTEKNHSEYAISKKKGEMAVWRGSQEGLKVLVVYPSVVIGSFDGLRESERIFELASKKKMFATPGITGYVDVRDVAFLMAELVEKQNWNESYILSSEDKSFAEILNYLRNKWKLPEVPVLTPFQLKIIQYLSYVGRIFGGKLISPSSYSALTGKAVYSNSKVKSGTGRAFIPVKEALDFHADRFKSFKTES